MTGFLAAGWTIALKDLRSEFRSAGDLLAMPLLGLLVILLFSFALPPGDTEGLRAGVLWAAIVFSGVVVIGKSFAAEKEGERLEGLLVCPIDRGALYVGKFLANLLMVCGCGAVLLAFFAVVSQAEVGATWLWLVLVVLLAAIGLSAVGTLFAAIAAGLRGRDAFLSVLVFPLLVPLVIAAARCSMVVQAGQGLAAAGLWPVLLAAYDVVFFTLSLVVFDFVVEE